MSDASGVTSPGLYFHARACQEHDPREQMPGMPETPERLEALGRHLRGLEWVGWQPREAPAAFDADVELIHSAEHVESIRELAMAGGGAADPETWVGEASYRAALHAAGAACEMARALLGGEARSRLLRRAASRPPRRTRSCDGLLPVQQRRDRRRAGDPRARRAAGVHHRLGRPPRQRHRRGLPLQTRRAVREHPRGRHLPGTGAADDAGSGEGEGYTINLPVPAGSDGELWLSLLEHVVIPAAAEFDPDLILDLRRL